VLQFPGSDDGLAVELLRFLVAGVSRRRRDKQKAEQPTPQAPTHGFCPSSGAAIIEIGKQMKCTAQRAQTVAGFDDLQPGFVVRLCHWVLPAIGKPQPQDRWAEDT